MKFYNVSTKKYVEVPDKECSCKKTKNNKHLCQAVVDGKKVSKFISKDKYDEMMKTKK